MSKQDQENTTAAIPPVKFNYGLDDLAPTSMRIGYHTLLHNLRSFELIHVPDKCSSHFSWYRSIPGNILPAGEEVAYTLNLTHSDMGKFILETSTDSFCIVLTHDETAPGWVEERPFRNRVIVIHQTMRYFDYDGFIQNIFLGNLFWEVRMDRVVYQKKNLDHLISVSQSVLNSFICITDSGFNLITRSKGDVPPLPIFQELVENGCYNQEVIDFLEEHVLRVVDKQTQILMIEPTAGCRFPTLHFPVFIDGAYLFHVVLVCNPDIEVECLQELFVHFTQRLLTICTDFWKSTVNLEAPWHRAFLKLINGDNDVTTDYLRTQLGQTEIASAKQFRLLMFKFSLTTTYQEQSALVEKSRKLNGGDCYPFMYEDRLLVLCYTKKRDDAQLSYWNCNKDVKSIIDGARSAVVVSSQLFYRITDMHMAFQQALIAYDMRETIDREADFTSYEDNPMLYSFEHVFPYYLFNADRDPAVMEYSFQNSITQIILEEDERNGTDLARLFWTYVTNERNATKTAKLLHVHRNTVLYHLQRLQERFDVSLDSPFARNRMILDYQYFFYSQRRITSIPLPGSDEARQYDDWHRE